MKKILFFIPTLTGGGAEKVLVAAIHALNPSKYDITVFTLLDMGVYKTHLGNNIRYKSIVKTQNLFFQKLFSYFIQFILPASWTYRLFVKENYDTEIAFLEGFPVKLIAHSKNKKAKKYTWVHTDLTVNYDSGAQFKNIQDNINCYKKFDKILCVSNEVREAFYQRFGHMDNVEIQYNVIDDADIAKKAKEYFPAFNPATVSLVTVGRLCKQKGFDRLIKVAKRLSDQGLLFDLWILGEGEEREHLQRAIFEYGLKDIVHLVGFVSNPYPYLQNADVFVCSSYAEGFSTVATEAIILGKSVITTDCAGMKDLLGESEYGIISENSEEGLYNGLHKMLSDPAVRTHYAAKAGERAKAFNLNQRISEYEKLLDE